MPINSVPINSAPINRAPINRMPIDSAWMKRKEAATPFVAVSFPPSFS